MLHTHSRRITNHYVCETSYIYHSNASPHQSIQICIVFYIYHSNASLHQSRKICIVFYISSTNDETSSASDESHSPHGSMESGAREGKTYCWGSTDAGACHILEREVVSEGWVTTWLLLGLRLQLRVLHPPPYIQPWDNVLHEMFIGPKVYLYSPYAVGTGAPTVTPPLPPLPLATIVQFL